MMNNSKRQQAEELEIFNQFANLASLNIEPSSIKTQLPPKPDIYCETSGGYGLEFDLVELQNPNFRESVHSQVIESRNLENAYRDYVAKQDTDLGARLDGAFVCVTLRANRQRRVFRKQYSEIFRLLADLPTSFAGEVCPVTEPLRSTVEEVCIRRGGWNGTTLSIENFSSAPCSWKEVLTNKFSKRYESTCETHLLAYNSFYTALPGDIMQMLVSEFVAGLASYGPFSKVWLYDARENRILIS